MRLAIFCFLLMIVLLDCITPREAGNESAENISRDISSNISEEINEAWEVQINEPN
ncbi:MAG: hypothetical protein QXT45_06460 [Candidatus Bilamarchaeaceae archaeon]